jgi:hypothetical protein
VRSYLTKIGVVEGLKVKTLSSSPSTTKKKKKEKLILINVTTTGIFKFSLPLAFTEDQYQKMIT